MHYIPTGVPPSGLERVASVLYRRRVRVLIVFLALFGSVVLGTALFPRLYDSRMKILIRNDRPELLVSPANVPSSVIASEVTDNTINTEIELLKSYDLLSEIVRECNLDKHAGDASQNMAAFEKAVRKLDRDLSVAAIRKSNIIQVTYAAKSPELAQGVLQKLATLYLDAHVRVHATAGTESFFHEQTKHFEEEMGDAAQHLNEFDRSNDIVSLELQKEVILRKATETEGDLRQAEASKAEIEKRNTEMQQKVAALDLRVVTQQRVLPNQYSVERLNTMLAELGNRRTLALMKFRPDDRVVQEIELEIDNTKNALDRSANLHAVEESTDRNPTRIDLEAELVRGQVQDHGLAARIGVLSTALTLLQKRLTRLDDATRFRDDLTRAYSRAQENFLLYARKEEEARIAVALDRQKIANVVIAETPMAQRTPASPNVPLNLCLGLLFATVAAVAVGVGGQFNHPTLRTPGELEAATGVAVLVAIPSRGDG
jgi:uncharacterized protein involved in exopolysaccharide biosynthesis